MAFWYDLCQAPVPVRDNRTVARAPDRQGYADLIFHLDDHIPEFERFVPGRCQIFFRIVRVQLFNQEILIVQIRCGDPPGELLVPTSKDDR